MSSTFIGLDVKLTLHSQPGSTLQAKILSIDQAANTLTVQKQDGSPVVLKRSDIASLAACKPSQTGSKSNPSTPSRSDAATPVTPQSKLKKHQQTLGAAPSAAPTSAQATATSFKDPAIISNSRTRDSRLSSAEQHASNPLLTALSTSDPTVSRSSTPSRSPRPNHAAPAASTPKSAKKMQHHAPISRGSSPAMPNASLTEDFDFSAGLKAFDKKKIWDDIRASDRTDPAFLLVSHNRISNGATELVRGPNGVGPANSFSTPDRGRSCVKDGQQKLRPNEMVCTPSPERASSPQLAAPSVDKSVETPTSGPRKPTYEQLEERIRKLEAELALARRRNLLLEELAGLGLGVSTRVDGVSPPAAAPVASPPHQPDTNATQFAAQPRAAPADLAITETEQRVSALTLRPETSALLSTPATFSNALAAASFAVSSDNVSAQTLPDPVPTTSTSAPSAVESKEAEAKKEPVFGHIVDPPVLMLLFPTAALQHAALARIEAFYESDSNAKRYLSLQEAADERICRNYQGFNFPLRQGVHEWLDAMFEATNSNADSAKWWTPHCSAEENELLDVLISLGAISPYEGASSRNDGESGSVSYVISCIASQAYSTLPHELLHALYFLSPPYRAFVKSQWDSLSAANKKVIETDLGLRKYSSSVFQDEFQAYLGEGLGTEKEFGNKPALECKEIAQQLRKQATKEWKKLGLNLESGQQQERWEEVKWQTLDRYAALQKASKKAGGGQAKGSKGGKNSRK